MMTRIEVLTKLEDAVSLYAAKATFSRVANLFCNF